jgi:hypothetical protein
MARSRLEATPPLGGFTDLRRLSYDLVTATDAAGFRHGTTGTVRSRMARGVLRPIRSGPQVQVPESRLKSCPSLGAWDSRGATTARVA